MTHTRGREHAHRRRRAAHPALPPMIVVAIAPVAAAVVATASPAVIDGHEDAARHELQTDEGEEDRSEEQRGAQVRHDASPGKIGDGAYPTFARNGPASYWTLCPRTRARGATSGGRTRPTAAQVVLHGQLGLEAFAVTREDGHGDHLPRLAIAHDRLALALRHHPVLDPHEPAALVPSPTS